MKYTKRAFANPDNIDYNGKEVFSLASKEKKKSHFTIKENDIIFKIIFPISNFDFEVFSITAVNNEIFIGISDKDSTPCIGKKKKALLIIDFESKDIITLDNKDIVYSQGCEFKINIVNDVRFFRSISKKKYKELKSAYGKPGEKGGGIIIEG